MFVVNVEGAVRKNDKWLIIRRSTQEEHAGGLLSLVGGKVDDEGHPSDILERTLKREVLEEVGVKIRDGLNYVHSASFVTDEGSPVVDIVFLGEYGSGEAHPKCPDEVEEVLWLTTEEVLNHSEASSCIERANGIIQTQS